MIEGESCLRIHKPESKWCPQLGTAEARSVAGIVLLNVITTMNTWGDSSLKNEYFLNCLNFTSMKILCYNTSVNKDTCMVSL